MGSGNLFLKKNLGKVIGKNSNLFRPEDDWDPLAPLQKKNPWESYKMMRMTGENDENDAWKLQLFLPFLTNLWFTLGERNENKNKGGCHHKKMMNIAPNRVMLKCEKSTHLGTQKTNPVPVCPWKVDLPVKDSSIPNINFQGRTVSFRWGCDFPTALQVFEQEKTQKSSFGQFSGLPFACNPLKLPLSKVCAKPYQAYAGFRHVCIPGLR